MHLRGGERNMIVIYEENGDHIHYMILKVLKYNEIVVAGLLAHTFHSLQPLDIGVFTLYKEKFRKLLSNRNIASKRNVRNEIFTFLSCWRKNIANLPWLTI